MPCAIAWPDLKNPNIKWIQDNWGVKMTCSWFEGTMGINSWWAQDHSWGESIWQLLPVVPLNPLSQSTKPFWWSPPISCDSSSSSSSSSIQSMQDFWAIHTRQSPVLVQSETPKSSGWISFSPGVSALVTPLVKERLEEPAKRLTGWDGGRPLRSKQRRRVGERANRNQAIFLAHCSFSHLFRFDYKWSELPQWFRVLLKSWPSWPETFLASNSMDQTERLMFASLGEKLSSLN